MATDLDLLDKATAANTKVQGGIDDVFRPIGRYTLLKRIARGGMGEVFLASTLGLEGAERPVVVKIIRREHAKDPSFIARFLDEARVQAQLHHSGVAQVLDAAIDDRTGEPYAVVEHVEGRSLGEVRGRAVQLGKAIAWPDAVALATLIAEALAHVHERPDSKGRALAIVHRDLSPQNVMVSYSGDVKIIDFGTARGLNRKCHTVAGVVFAKPGYVAPEVANGDSGDARVDLYALGIMLWELCAGRRFLQGDANVHMAAVARNAKNPPPIADQVGAPAALDEVIARLTAFDRDLRYAPGPAAARDLAKILGSADALPSGERSVRARAAALLQALFPGEPSKSRSEFARLVVEARDARSELPTPAKPAAPAPAPEQPRAAIVEDGDLVPGTRYRLGREIGRGSSSIVYEAEHADLGRKVALKVLSAERSASEELAARFRREARALSMLSHEGLVKVHDFGVTASGQLFSAMELLSGETLEAFLARAKGYDYRHVLRIGKLALGALAAAHRAGVIHRDIKPANLFLTEGGGLKILDFGLAKAPETASHASFASERVGFTLFGTPEYMAPEQAASGQVDARADLYALGCVLYEMLTGRLPFVGVSHVAILDAKIKGSPERLRDRAPARAVPAAVDELVMRALARHPSVRYQTAEEMIAAIDAALAVPEQRRAGRRMIGYAALAIAMATASFLVVSKAKQIRAQMPWGHRSAPTEQVAVAAPPPAMPAQGAAPATDPSAAAAAIAPAAANAANAAGAPAKAEDPAVAMEDDELADFVDDTPEKVDPAEIVPDPKPASKAAAAHKRGKDARASAKAASAKAKSAAGDPPAALPESGAGPALAAADAAKPGKAVHHKHKARAAKAP